MKNLFALLLMMAFAAQAQEALTLKIYSVTDGDTVKVRDSSGQQVKLRLAGIDCPEKGQPWGRQATNAAKAYMAGERATVYPETTDNYGRLIARVIVDGVNINRQLVKDGHCWEYVRFNHDAVIGRLQREAEVAGRGLWGLPEAERAPPWEWRHGGGSRQAPGNNQVIEGCYGKRYCSQMSSCEEARHYLRNCGVKTLDGDKDGVPCEKLCR